MKPLKSLKLLSSRPGRLWALAASVLVLVVTFSLALLLAWRQPQRRALERYVSAPLDASGTRVECLRPVGWHLTYVSVHGKGRSLTLEPSDRLALVRRRFPVPFIRWLPSPERGELILTLFPVVDARTRRFNKLNIDNARVRVYPQGDLPSGPISSNCAMRRIVSDDGSYVLDIKYSRYSMAEQEAFERTYKQIVASLRIAEAATP